MWDLKSLTSFDVEREKKAKKNGKIKFEKKVYVPIYHHHSGETGLLKMCNGSEKFMQAPPHSTFTTSYRLRHRSNWMKC